MERPCQLDEAVGHRLLAVERHKVVVVEELRDLEAQAVLGVGVAPEVDGPERTVTPDQRPDRPDGFANRCTPPTGVAGSADRALEADGPQRRA